MSTPCVGVPHTLTLLLRYTMPLHGYHGWWCVLAHCAFYHTTSTYTAPTSLHYTVSLCMASCCVLCIIAPTWCVTPTATPLPSIPLALHGACWCVVGAVQYTLCHHAPTSSLHLLPPLALTLCLLVYGCVCCTSTQCTCAIYCTCSYHPYH